MRSWQHSGFSVDQSVFLPAGDQAGIERLVQYMTRCPFIEPPQADVIEAILTHCGLWRSRAPRTPPAVDELVLELDAAYADNSLGSGNQAESSQEWTYVDIDTFLESF